MEDLEAEVDALKTERAALVALLERAASEIERRALQDRLQNIDIQILALEEGDDA